MKQADRNRKKSLIEPPRFVAEPTFKDADYQQHMRVDPLTATAAMNAELISLNEKRAQRALEAEEQKREADKAKADEEFEKRVQDEVAKRIED